MITQSPLKKKIPGGDQAHREEGPVQLSHHGFGLGIARKALKNVLMRNSHELINMNYVSDYEVFCLLVDFVSMSIFETFFVQLGGHGTVSSNCVYNCKYFFR